MSSEPAVRVRDVSKHYLMFDRPEDRLKQMIVPRLQRLAGRPPRCFHRDFAALKSVTFDVQRGETVGIIGRNGSGKSTLLQIICGTLQPTSGMVEVNGRIAALLELGAGFNPEFTGRDNVFLNAAILGLGTAEIEARFDDIARFADIGSFIDQPVKTYSSGMYVRLAFATAINVDPDILVVDEALAVGDEAFQRKCYARIENIKEKGGTILFVSHGAQTIVQLCDRAILIDRGEVLLDGRPKMVVGQYQRLVNASAEAAADIRSSIAAYRLSPKKPTDLGDPQSREREIPIDEDDGLADYFDARLTSQSAVSLERRGACITNIMITTESGRPVNVLRTGKRYCFMYNVQFAQEAESVGFGMWIRTASGFGLGGAQTAFEPREIMANISAGSLITVRIDFDCHLLAGTYFFNCGVIGRLHDELIVMHRIIDALAARVAPTSTASRAGIIDFRAVVTVDVRNGT